MDVKGELNFFVKIKKNKKNFFWGGVRLGGGGVRLVGWVG